MARVRAQHREIARLNRALPSFHIFKGIEANIAADGSIDVSAGDAREFDLILAAPHSKLRKAEDQTARLLRAIESPAHILAHPRGRISSTRAGVVADWDRVFVHAARHRVAVELDGDPSRQDLDYELARRAVEAGCLFALDSDAHGPSQLLFTETALAHARLAGIPADRIVNCWTLPEVERWLSTTR
jgi:histidinol phosphatase-like PHP family hydrolase